MPRDTAADQELARVKRLASRAERSMKSRRWRRAMQRRAARVSAVVRALPALILADRFTVSKTSGAWTVTVDGETVVVISTKTPARSLEEIDAPLPMRVVRFELVNPELVMRLFAFEYVSFIP